MKTILTTLILFLTFGCTDPGYEKIKVKAVQNPHQSAKVEIKSNNNKVSVEQSGNGESVVEINGQVWVNGVLQDSNTFAK